MYAYAAGAIVLGMLLAAAAARASGVRRLPVRWFFSLGFGSAAGACLGFAVGLLGWVAAGAPTPAVEAWAPGVEHRRVVTDTPGEGPVVMHVVEIDLERAAPSFGLWPPPGHTGGSGFENRVGRLAVTTGTDAVAATGADLVVNASHFGPIYGDLLFWSYPRRGDPVLPVGAVLGGAASAGIAKPAWPLVRFGPGAAVSIEPASAGGDATAGPGVVAFAGRSVLVENGAPTPHGGHLAGDRYPRCTLGLDATGNRLFLVVVDGKQPRRSVGLTLAALANRLVAMGVHTAVELDGGGSAQFTRRVGVVNSPCHQKLPQWERPVANHLTIRFGG